MCSQGCVKAKEESRVEVQESEGRQGMRRRARARAAAKKTMKKKFEKLKGLRFRKKKKR